MKIASTLLSILLFSFADINGQTIPNAGFENWTLIAGQYMNPDDWETNAADFSINVVRVSPGYSGNYALELNTTGYARSKFSFSQHPSTVSAYVKSAVSALDTVKIQAFVYSGDNIVDYGDWINTFSISNWTLITFPVSVSFSSIDSLEIRITCGNLTGTSLSVDELSFSPTTGIKEDIKVDNFIIFPIPFSLQTTLKTNRNLNNATLLIKNSMGQTVSKEVNISGNSFTIQRDNLPSGLYFIQLTQDNEIISIKKIFIAD